MPGAETRSRSASSRAVTPGCVLIAISSETCPPVTPIEWISRRRWRASRSSVGRSLFAIVRESLTERTINCVNGSGPPRGGAGGSDLPEAVADEGHAAALLRHARRLEVVGADHHVDVRSRPVDAVPGAADGDGPRLGEAGAERHVRRGVLVQKAVVVDAPRPADARGRIDERDLAEAVGVRDRREVAGEPVAIGVALRRQPDEPAAAELPRELLEHAAAEVTWSGTAEGPFGRGRVGRDEALLGRDVHRDPVPPARLLAPAAPHR